MATDRRLAGNGTGPQPVVFVGELPAKKNGTNRQVRELRYDLLTERPGEWAEWWGDRNSAHKVAGRVQREGFRFEAAIRDGKAYMRAVQL